MAYSAIFIKAGQSDNKNVPDALFKCQVHRLLFCVWLACCIVFLKNELLNNHNQMQKDVQLYQRQIEAGKASYRKMQADLQRELQSLFQENTRLTSLMEGKVPKGTVPGDAFSLLPLSFLFPVMVEDRQGFGSCLSQYMEILSV